MKKSILVLSVFLLFAAIIAVVSYVTLLNVSEIAKVAVPLDKAEIIYNKGVDLYDTGNSDESVQVFKLLVKEYPDSKYLEKSIRKLAAIFYDKEEYVKTVYFYELLLKKFPKISDETKVRAVLKDLNSKLMKADNSGSEVLVYEVKPGDSLYVIAKKYKTTVELIKQLNNLSSDMIRIGQKLTINIAEFSIFVDRQKNILELKQNGRVFKTYSVATGRENGTPVGSFLIVDKIVRPPWTKPGVGVIMPDDERYELGERWMAISKKGYGIHGTNDDSSIGKQSTAGCVRMYNSDVIELYNIVPVGTRVDIADGVNVSIESI